MKDKYFEIIVTSDNALDLFKNFVLEMGVVCIEEIQNGFVVRDEDELDNLEFALNEYKKALEKALNLDIDLKISKSIKENKDWFEEYKKGVKAIAVGDFYIRPSWQEPKNGLKNIVIDPGLAFGSGHHESTNMCLNLVQNYTKKGDSTLDVGCGSGILSLVMASLGASVSACDTDEIAIKATLENAQKNGLNLSKTWVGSVSISDEKYDIVVANIIADVILMLQNDLKSHVKIGGILILSGILDKYLDRIKTAFKDFKLLELRQENEWLSFVFEKER